MRVDIFLMDTNLYRIEIQKIIEFQKQYIDQLFRFFVPCHATVFDFYQDLLSEHSNVFLLPLFYWNDYAIFNSFFRKFRLHSETIIIISKLVDLIYILSLNKNLLCDLQKNYIKLCHRVIVNKIVNKIVNNNKPKQKTSVHLNSFFFNDETFSIFQFPSTFKLSCKDVFLYQDFFIEE